MIDITFIDVPEEFQDTITTIFNKTKEYHSTSKEYVSVVGVSNEKIQELNNQFRNKDYVTDVLSFVSEEDDEYGDIIVSFDKALEQSKEYEHSLLREVSFLSLHGFLHLNGYDHLNEEDEKEMINMQNKILDELNIKR